MTKEQLAALLDGREYLKEITREEEAQAKAAGLLVIFGQSDDLVELRGTENDECGAWDGTIVYITREGRLFPSFDSLNKDDEDELQAYFKAKQSGIFEVEAKWCPEFIDGEPFNGSWAFETSVPYATFDIMDEGELYCRGIVIDVADLNRSTP